MKYFLKFHFLILLAIVFISSCTQDEVKNIEGSLELSFDQQSLNNQRTAEDTAKSILITIEDESGNTIVNRINVPLFNFNGDYISEPIALEVGSYFLTEFLVLNKEGQVIYASPLEGSNLDYLVGAPLPIALDIQQNETTKLTPEVISVGQVDALDFGYSTFSFDLIETFDFLISVFQYNASLKNFELTTADLQIKSEENLLYSKELGDSTNQVRVPDNHTLYELTISKEGFSDITKTIDVDQLKAYLNSPLIITFLPENELLVGIIDDKIVTIDPETGEATTITSIEGLPSDVNWKTLTYANDLFYFINNSSNSPELYKVSVDGIASKVGNFLYEGEQVEIVEAIAFNKESNQLIISASLDGGVSNDDFYTESLLEVDPTTGNCEFVASFDNGEIDPDIDAITFSGDVFYAFDGAPPGQDFTKFYESDFNLVDGNVLSSIYSTSYFHVSDLAVLNNQMYYLKERSLYKLDLSDYSSTLVGETHSVSEFGGEIIEGMTLMK